LIWTEDKFRALLESAPDAMVIVDASGTIMLVNAQTEKLFGYKREELLGKPVEMLMPDRFRGNHLGHREKYAKVPRLRMMGSGMELFGRRKDGTEVPVDISLSPFKSKDGLLVFSAIRDITLQKRAQKELAEAKETLELRVRDRTAELQQSNQALEAEIARRELAECLLAKRPEMKVLYMSGYTNGILSEHAFRAEDSAFIEKPFSHDALSRKVRHTLNPQAC
jgi:PAS domain S-box-containing protein